jgi:hypothetical protein
VTEDEEARRWLPMREAGMRSIVVRVALHSLALAGINLAGILAAYGVYYYAFRPGNQILIQAPLAAAFSIAAFVGWVWLLGRQRWVWARAAWRGLSEAALTWVLAFAWIAVLFVPLHFATQGYLTAASNVLAIWAFQAPVNAATVALAWRAGGRPPLAMGK